MKKILLIAPCKLNSNEVNWGAPPLGIYRLAHYLEREGRDIDIINVFDPAILGLPNANDLTGYDFIGFSPLDETLADDIKIMNLASQVNPNATLICGGVEATLNYQTILEKTKVEWIVTGYGETAFNAIIGGHKDIQGTIHRQYSKPTTSNDIAEFYDTLRFSDMGYEKYWKETEKLYGDHADLDSIRTVRLVTSSGCNRGCAFCSVTQWQKYSTGGVFKPAILEVDDLINLVKRVKEEVPDMRTVYFCEDDFCQDRERVEEFCRWSRNSGLRYLIQTHLSRVDYPLLAELALGGIEHLTLGIENASDNVLKSFHKQQDLSKVPHVIEKCLSLGITPYLLIILFAPESTLMDLKINIEVLSQWMDIGAKVSIEPFCMPYRGAPLYESLHDFEYDVVQIDKHTKLKRALRILPDDLAVRDIMLTFKKQWPEYKKEHAEKHQFKGETGKLMLQLLKQIMEGAAFYG